jgi:hypothetical protein
MLGSDEKQLTDALEGRERNRTDVRSFAGSRINRRIK